MQLAGFAAGHLPGRVVALIYSSPLLSRLARSLLNAAAPSRIQEVEVRAGPLTGRRFALDLRSEKYLWFGNCEPWMQQEMMAHLRPGDWAWEIGANIGYHTVLLRQLCGPNRVVALEPDPVNLLRLRTNLSLNDATDVQVIPKAAGDTCGYVGLSHGGTGRQTSVASNDDRVRVPVTTLDALLAEAQAPKLISVDVEGAEIAVLDGAIRLLHEVQPVWLVELHGGLAEVASHRLREAGYHVRKIHVAEPETPGMPRLTYIVAEPLPEGNGHREDDR